jgi:hypothetical protein
MMVIIRGVGCSARLIVDAMVMDGSLSWWRREGGIEAL